MLKCSFLFSILIKRGKSGWLGEDKPWGSATLKQKFSCSNHRATDSQSSKECARSSTLSSSWWHLLLSVALYLLLCPGLLEPLFSFGNSLCPYFGGTINRGIQISPSQTWHLPSENMNLKISDWSSKKPVESDLFLLCHCEVTLLISVTEIYKPTLVLLFPNTFSSNQWIFIFIYFHIFVFS